MSISHLCGPSPVVEERDSHVVGGRIVQQLPFPRPYSDGVWVLRDSMESSINVRIIGHEPSYEANELLLTLGSLGFSPISFVPTLLWGWSRKNNLL